MLTHDQYIQIRYLATVEHLNSAQIGEKLGIPERTVRHWWRLERYPQKSELERNRITDEFTEKIKLMVSDNPKLTGTQVYQRLQGFGYAGSPSTIRRYLTSIRPKKIRSFLTLSFEPGEAMQVDFGYCGYLWQGKRRMRLCTCAVVLCHSRLMYADFIPSEKMEHTFECLQNALHFFGGVPRKIIVDNFKGAVLHHNRHGEIQYNPRFLDFTNHYGMLPVACNVRSPHEKGRIENGIGYIKGNLVSGRNFTSLEEARTSLQLWLEKIANVRIHGTTKKRPIDIFKQEEKSMLLPLNSHRFDCARNETRLANTRCRVNCDGNLYSVPSRCAGATVNVKITTDTVYIHHEGKLVAIHTRNYGKGEEIIDQRHYQVMLDERRTAAKQNLKSDFLALGRDAAITFRELQTRLENPEKHMKKIMLLSQMYGKETVQNALMSAVENQVYGSDYIEFLIRLKSRPVENSMGLLHVTKGADNLNISLETPDLETYDIK